MIEAINPIPSTDKEFKEYTVDHVSEGKGGWTVALSGGSCLYVTNEHQDTAPTVGEPMRCYGRGFGHVVRGVVIGGRCYRYETPAQLKASHERQNRAREIEKQEEHERTRIAKDWRAACLSLPFRKRIIRFERHGGTKWRIEFEKYELFVCEQANALVSALGSSERVVEFAQLPWEKQNEAVPDWSEGHSGNTAGASTLLALTCLKNPEQVTEVHGAMCPLVGCDEYGCFAAVGT